MTEDKKMTDKALHERILQENEQAVDDLVEQLQSSSGVIPFVGAGMSKGFGFPEWGEFLRSTAEATTKQAQIEKFIDNGDFEGAAQELNNIDSDWFQKKIDHIFRRDLDPQKLIVGAISLLPYLTEGPVITTNFDKVIEDTFREAGKEFKECICGPQPYRIVKAIHQNRRALLKIHGDCEDRTFRTFTKWEYEQSYKTGDAEHVTLSSLAWLMFTNRPLLFLGCSLERDRTVKVLREIHQKLAGLNHFAIIAAPRSVPEFVKRKEDLLACGISPIWFPPGQFKRIEEILRSLVDRISMRELAPISDDKPADAPSGDMAIGSFKEIVTAEDGNSELDLPHEIKRICQTVVDGRIAFFLGSYAHLGTFVLGDEFYRDLAEKYKAPYLAEARAATASYVRDRRGTQTLLKEIRNTLSTKKTTPSLVYRFLAGLPGFLRANKREKAASLFVFTTNYDLMLEKTLAMAAEPFHLLYYIGGGEYEGLFAYRAPGGRECIIVRPENIREFVPSATIIVKLHGGIVYGRKIPESLLIGRGDFERLAGRLPAALPTAVRKALHERSLLFLGHGLIEPDVEALVRYGGAEGPKAESWAVQKPGVSKKQVQYWDMCGLQIIEADLKTFTKDLHHSLLDICA